MSAQLDRTRHVAVIAVNSQVFTHRAARAPGDFTRRGSVDVWAHSNGSQHLIRTQRDRDSPPDRPRDATNHTSVQNSAPSRFSAHDGLPRHKATPAQRRARTRARAPPVHGRWRAVRRAHTACPRKPPRPNRQLGSERGGLQAPLCHLGARPSHPGPPRCRWLPVAAAQW
jgi:hypothetical protein